MVDMHLSTADVWHFVLSRQTRLNKERELLVRQLGMTLPYRVATSPVTGGAVQAAHAGLVFLADEVGGGA